MKICLEALGKRYQRHWVFRGLTHEFAATSRTAILGHNGSGKSTILRIMGGLQPPSTGKVTWLANSQSLDQPNVFRAISFCAPGMELPEELNLEEALQFHFSFKKLIHGYTIASVIDTIGLRAAAKKPIGDYSSGMKQRVKLAQAFFSDTPVLLLDEPCTNLDEAGVIQYQDWVERFTAGRTVLVASNDPREYRFCESEILMRNYQ
jgi:ABC-type multidrug transport system ATPase subunit